MLGYRMALHKRFGNYAAVALVSMITSQVLVFGVIKILTTSLTQDAYGLYAVLISLGSLIGALGSSLFTNGIWRYAEKYRVTGRSDLVAGLMRRALKTSALLNGILFVALIMISLVSGVRLLDLTPDVYTIALVYAGSYSVAQSISLLLTSLAQGNQDTRLILTTQMVFCVTNLLAALVGVLIILQVLDIFGLVAFALLFTGGGVFFLSQRGIEAKGVGLHDVGEVIRFSVPLAIRNLMVSGISVFLLLYAQITWDLTLSAIISVGFSILVLLTAVIQNLYSAYRQFAVATHETMGHQETDFSDVFKASLPLMAALFIGAFWLYQLAPFFVPILSTNEYMAAAGFVQMILPATCFLWFGYIYGTTGNYLSEKVHLEMISAAIGFCAMLVVAIIWVPNTGLMGIAYSYSAFCIVTAGFNLVSGNLVYRPIIRARGLLKFALTVFAHIATFLGFQSVMGSTIISGLIATLFFVLLQLKLGLLDTRYIPFKIPGIRSSTEQNRNEPVD